MKNIIFSAKIIELGSETIVKGHTFRYQPPRKNRALRPDIRIILLYSARKKSAKPMAEYSTL